MAQTEDLPAVLRRPLYVFDLPEELLYSLTLRAPDSQLPPTPATPETPTLTKPTKPTAAAASDKDAPASPSTATSCGLCGLSFPALQEQRNHVKSDLHRYNLKQKMRGLPPVGEAEFEKLVGDLDESLSGSESSSSAAGSESDDGGGGGGHGGARDSTLTALLRRQAKLARHNGQDDDTEVRRHGGGRQPLLWFASSAVPRNVSLGIYRALFSAAEQDEPTHIVDTIRKKQLAPIQAHSNARQQAAGGASPAQKSPHYFLCMIGGGHFAAMLVSLQPKVTKKAGGLTERQAVVLAHKTFHRYTTRRKQGGSQSASDAAKGAAHSAGSSLRRYNEAALTGEVRGLLAEWKAAIDSAELCFVRATGSTNRQTLFGPYDGQVLRQNDPRMRGFPFSTRRATQKELMRAFVELTRVKVSTVDEAALAAAAAQAQTEAEKSRDATAAQGGAAKQPKPPRPSEEEEAALLHTQQIQALIRRSKAPALLSYMQSNSLSSGFRFFPPAQNHHTPTPLHLAASLSSPAIVTTLLTKASADPTVKSEEGKTAFDLAGDRATRDAFRLARHQLGEAAWPWDAANVPLGLSPAEAESRSQRERQEREAEEKKEAERRKAETERLRREDVENAEAQHERKFGKGKQLSGGSAGLAMRPKTAQEAREEETRGMTPELRARLERERRARAAEERIRRLQGGGGGGGGRT